MFLAILSTLSDCSSVKSLCPQKINFHHFPLEWTWQQTKCLSFGKSLSILKERYFSKGSPEPRQTKNEEKTVLSLFWGQGLPRGMIRVLAPCGTGLTVFTSNAAVPAGLSLPAARKQIWPQTSCPVPFKWAVLFYFVCCCQPAFSPLLLEQQKCWLVGTEAAFPSH